MSTRAFPRSDSALEQCAPIVLQGVCVRQGVSVAGNRISLALGRLRQKVLAEKLGACGIGRPSGRADRGACGVVQRLFCDWGEITA